MFLYIFQILNNCIHSHFFAKNLSRVWDFSFFLTLFGLTLRISTSSKLLFYVKFLYGLIYILSFSLEAVLSSRLSDLGDWTEKYDLICGDCAFLISATVLKLVTATPIVKAGRHRSCIYRKSGMTLSQSDLGLLR